MAYSAEISRANPTCLLFLTDQSSSMAASFGRQPDKRKCDGVAEAINRLLYDLSLKCAGPTAFASTAMSASWVTARPSGRRSGGA